MEAFDENQEVPGTATDLEDPMTWPQLRLIDQLSVVRVEAQQLLERIVKGEQPTIPEAWDVGLLRLFCSRTHARPSSRVFRTTSRHESSIKGESEAAKSESSAFMGLFSVYHEPCVCWRRDDPPTSRQIVRRHRLHERLRWTLSANCCCRFCAVGEDREQRGRMGLGTTRMLGSRRDGP